MLKEISARWLLPIVIISEIARANSAAERNIKKQVNTIQMERLHSRDIESSDLKKLESKIESYQSVESNIEEPAKWSLESIELPETGELVLKGFLSKLKSWVETDKVPAYDEIAIDFVASDNNQITVLSDKEDFWPKLMTDLESAEDSINIVMFGLMGDEWGHEVFDLLKNKVKAGVKVRVLADALGARSHWYFKHVNAEFIQDLRDNGIDIILTKDDSTYGNWHFDHRKFYIIDGKLAHNTGYTIEEHMRYIHFDMAYRITGDMVKQLQGLFFASFFYFGGKLSDDEKNIETFMERYFPEGAIIPQEMQSNARLLTNLPRVQHRATEAYFKAIDNAKSKIIIVNEFLSEPKFLKKLEAQAKKGLKIQIIYPRECEWELHRNEAFHFFEKIKDYPGVEIYLYDGPQNTGWLHTKGIIVDDQYTNFGSTNMDSLSLFQNFEVNIESNDSKIVRQTQEKIVDYAIQYSVPYKSPETLGDKIDIWMSPIVTFPLKYFVKAL